MTPQIYQDFIQDITYPVIIILSLLSSLPTTFKEDKSKMSLFCVCISNVWFVYPYEIFLKRKYLVSVPGGFVTTFL